MSRVDSVPWTAVAILGTGLFGLGIAVGSYGGVVTALVARGTDPAVAGFGMTLYLLGQLVVVLPADRLARRYSVRAVAAVAFLVGAAGTALAGSLTLTAAYVSRTLLGLGMGTAFLASMTYGGLRTRGAATASTQGALGALFTLGLAAGVAAGPAALATVGPWLPPAVAVACILPAAALARRLPPTPDRDRLPTAAYLRAVASPGALALGLGNMVTFGFLIVATTWYADVAARIPGAPTTAVLVGFSVATVLGRGGGGRLAARLGDRLAVAVSLCGLAASLGVVAAALALDLTGLLLAGLVATGAGFGLPFGPLFALAFANVGEEGGVTLVAMTAMGNAGALAFPWLVGVLLSSFDSYAPGFGLMAVVVVATVGVWLAAFGLHGAPAGHAGGSPE